MRFERGFVIEIALGVEIFLRYGFHDRFEFVHERKLGLRGEIVYPAHLESPLGGGDDIDGVRLFDLQAGIALSHILLFVGHIVLRRLQVGAFGDDIGDGGIAALFELAVFKGRIMRDKGQKALFVRYLFIFETGFRAFAPLGEVRDVVIDKFRGDGLFLARRSDLSDGHVVRARGEGAPVPLPLAVRIAHAHFRGLVIRIAHIIGIFALFLLDAKFRPRMIGIDVQILLIVGVFLPVDDGLTHIFQLVRRVRIDARIAVGHDEMNVLIDERIRIGRTCDDDALFAVAADHAVAPPVLKILLVLFDLSKRARERRLRRGGELRSRRRIIRLTGSQSAQSAGDKTQRDNKNDKLAFFHNYPLY